MPDLRTLDRRLQPYADHLYRVARERRWAPIITSAYRSSSLQKKLYERYKSGKSRFPAAPPGTSLHEYRLAFDMDLGDERNLAYLGRLWESFGRGFVWGGRFRDAVHFEFRPSNWPKKR